MTSHRPDWQNQRQKVIDAQNNHCARQDCPYVGSLDVIRVHGVLMGFCRRDRLKIDGAERASLAARTRGTKGTRQRSWI
jgi:hypothetical protein